MLSRADCATKTTVRFCLPIIVFVVACSSTRTVQVPIEFPAAFSVGAARGVWIASGSDENSLAVADLLTGHLAGRSPALRQVSLAQLEPARTRRQIPAGTLVLLVEVQMVESSDTRFIQQPQTFCGPGGCYTQYRSFPYQVPAIAGQLRLTGYDGPTANVLAQRVLRAAGSSRSRMGLQRQVALELVERALPLFESRPGSFSVELMNADAASHQAALEALESGAHEAARTQLAGMTRRETLASLSTAEQARVFHNLAQTLRLLAVRIRSPEDVLELLQQAVAALDHAQRLAPDNERVRLTGAGLGAQVAQLQRRLRSRAALSATAPPPLAPEPGAPPKPEPLAPLPAVPSSYQ